MKLAVLGKDAVTANVATNLLTNVGALNPNNPLASAFIVKGLTATDTVNLTIDPFSAAGWAALAEAAGHIMVNTTTGQFICGTALVTGDMIVSAVNPLGELAHVT